MNLAYVSLAILLLIFNAWSLYNVPAFVIGIKELLKSRRMKQKSVQPAPKSVLPFVSVVVPVKNEEKVVGRLLRSLMRFDYPENSLEILVVNDESNDGTRQICEDYAKWHPHLKVFNRAKSSTKAAALNFGVAHARGEIIATFDADSVPEPDCILRAMEHFGNTEVAAVQGRIYSINSNENMLTRFLSYESAVHYEVLTRGKDKLNLFVGLAGTCQFIRRSSLDEIGGWNEGCLSEDLELSLRLTEKDHVIEYASDVHTWEESPNDLRGLVRQRARWYRGNITMGLRFGRLMKKLSMRRFDAEMNLFGTYLIVLCVLTYFMAAWSFLLSDSIWLTWVMRFTSFCTVLVLASAGLALIHDTEPVRISNVMWLPFIYAYWGFQSFIAMYAVGQIVFRRPTKWSKTLRSGIVTSDAAMRILAAD